MKKSILSFALFIGIVFGVSIWYYFYGGNVWLAQYIPATEMNNIIMSMLSIAAILIAYYIGMRVIKVKVINSKGSAGENTMLRGVFQFVMIIVALFIIISTWVSIGTLGTILMAFGGMFLGWSLQAPISGIAAWFLISVVRPFRVGDRIQLPAHGIVGDVVSISPLYTTLNQVGGSVGSEEPADRTILIPNAMLFGALVINYTPKHQDELIKHSRETQACRANESVPAYMLDEFVLRMSFDSDWEEAEKILLDAARAVTGGIIKETGTEPYIRADWGDWYGVFMRLRFMTNATERPKIIYEISKLVYKAVQESTKVDIAIPYIYSYRKGLQWAPPKSIEKLDPREDSGLMKKQP